MKSLSPLKFVAVPKLLDHIGLAMYSKYTKAIGELIINGYDADATEVMEKDFKRILSEALGNLELTGSGEDNQKRIGIGKALVALTLVIDNIWDKLGQTTAELKSLNSNLTEFNKKSGQLQKWLIFWTAIIALATIVSLLT